MPYPAKPLLLALSLAAGLLASRPSHAQAWMDTLWTHRRPVAVANPGGTSLTDFQVRVGLDTSFDFTKARSDGGDLRVTAGDGTTALPFWIGSWNAGTRQATIWVRIPSLPAGGTTLYLYYGNPSASSASSGGSTFDFFDDFESPSSVPGYYGLSSPGATILVQDQSWETSAPHTLDVVDWNHDGYRYWGYYGLQATAGGPVGLCRSNDLAHWDKYTVGPVINVVDARWPTIALVGGVLNLFYAQNNGGQGGVVRVTSTDGVNFTSPPTTVVPPVAGFSIGNPHLFLNPVDGHFYLYWAQIGSNMWQIMVRSATTLNGLASATSSLVISASQTLAAPNLMYRDGTYFLTVETFPGSVWETDLWTSTTSPVSGFTRSAASPILADGSACFSQHVFGTTLWAYYAHLIGSTWSMEYRSADLTAGRQPAYVPDVTKWTASGGFWNVVSEPQQTGNVGRVCQGMTSGYQILRSSYSGADGVLEGYGRLVNGQEWALATHVTGPLDFISARAQEAEDRVYVQEWSGSPAPHDIGGPGVATMDPGTWYQLTMKTHGSTVDTYVNDALLTSGSALGTHPSGNVALFDEDGQVAEWNDVRVRKYAASEPVATLLADQGLAPVIGAVAAAPGPLGTSATVSWTTDRSATSSVSYGLSAGSLNLGASSPGLVTSHAVAIGGLTPGTTYFFRVSSTDASGHTATAPPPPSSPLSFTTSSIGTVAAFPPPGSCLAVGGCAAIPVRIARADASPMRAYHVRVSLGPDLVLCGAGFVSDTLLSQVGPASFRVTALGGGAYAVDDSLQGTACGATASGGLFHVTVSAAVSSGTALVSLDSLAVLGCGDLPLPVNTGPPAQVAIVGSGPDAVTGLQAATVVPGGGTGGRTGIRVTLTPPADGSRVEVYRRAFGNYPAYDGGATPGSVPLAPTGYPPAGWTLTGVQATGDLDHPPTRDVWYYVAFSVDSCGGTTVSVPSGGALDYLLGDVHDGATPCSGDDQVTDADVDFLATHYGAAGGLPDTIGCLDVGPTTTGWVDGRPLTDGRLDVEDLACLAEDYGVTSQTDPTRPPPGGPGPGGSTLALVTGAIPGVDSTFDAVLGFQGMGDVQVLRATMAYDTLVARPVGLVPGALLGQQAGPARVLSPAPGVVDAAVFGRGRAFQGSGELARVTFRVLAAGDPRVRLDAVEARDPSNRTVSLVQNVGTGTSPLPAQVVLGRGYPNPFRVSTTVLFGLPGGGPVTLRVFDIQGRTVRRLWDGPAPPGWTRVSWDGRGEDGRPLPTGAYLVQLAAGGHVTTRSLLLVR